MSHQLWQPCEALKPFIRHLIISRTETPETHLILPDTNLVAGFQFSGRISHVTENTEISLDVNGVTGQLDRYRVFKNAADTGTVLIVFTETGAVNFITTPLHELFGHSLSLEHFFKSSEVQHIHDRLATAQTDKERIKIVEDFLLSQLNDTKVNQMVAGAIHQIYQSKGTVRIKQLAEWLNTSQSPLEKRFRAAVGTSPKKFARIVRACYVLDALNQNDQRTAAYLSDFYDQAHFIKDFKTFSSMTPEQYLQSLRQEKK